MSDSNAIVVLRRYKSHKIVQAAKIIDFVWLSHILVKGYDDAPVVVKPLRTFWDRAVGILGSEGGEDRGYYVKYRDDFSSWSPSSEFEAGYAEIVDGENL